MISNVPDLGILAEALGTGKLISKAIQKEKTQFVDQVPPLPSGIPETADGMDPGYGLLFFATVSKIIFPGSFPDVK